MILQALKEYYDRKPDLPRAGFEMKEIPYVLVLNADGIPVNLTDTYEGMGKERQAKKFLVPQSVKRTVDISANLLWDNPEYALGIVCKGKPARVANQHLAFRKRLDDLKLPHDPALLAVQKFLANPEKSTLLEAFGDRLEEMRKTGAFLSFRIVGQIGLILEQPAIREAITKTLSTRRESICMVTGERDETEQVHAAIKGVWGAQKSGANIVSFNLDAFRSFNKKQGANAPVGKTAAFSYTTALNHLLDKTSKQRIQVGDASTVFWSQKADPMEELMPSFFNEPPKDDPDRNVRAVEALFKAVRTGAYSSDDSNTRFYTLGLAPNASRISIRFWIVDTIAGMAEKICRHFEDTKVVHGPRDKDTLSLFRLLVSTAALGEAKNIAPNLGGDMMRSVLEGLPYPQTLLQAAVRRARIEREMTYTRAAIIKACLNRAFRFNNPTHKEELKVSLDTANPNIGYRLGRLFAALEKIQSEAVPGINATIRDRFYGAASSTPVTVFGNLMRLKNHHLSKLENVGRRIYFDKLLGEIVSEIVDFPAHLCMADQGRFAIGYYHQMQDFYSKKNHNPEKED